MGYESTLIVAELMGIAGRPGTYILPVAIFDLSKMGYDGDFAELVTARRTRIDGDRYYWYPALAYGDTAGDSHVHLDPYGQPPTTLNFDTTILALEADDGGYRRIAPVIAALKVYAAQLAEKKWNPDHFGLFHLGH
jgi:hypothetical protein